MLKSAVFKFVIAGAVFAPVAVSAATVHESDFPAGFSNAYASPTEITEVFAGVSGTGSSNDYDFLHLSNMASGEQTLTFAFSTDDATDWSYSAGGVVKYSQSPLLYSAWDGSDVGSFQLSYGADSDTQVLNLPASFGGDLYLSFLFTHGNGIDYTVTSSASAAISPVPLPATGLMLGGAVLALGMGRALRRKAKH